MRTLRSGPVMLVCDEHTALGVMRELEGSGLLVLSPNSDQAVIHSADRRITPAHYYGFGLRRHNNWPLISYLTEAMSAYLALETESIAVWYGDLYNRLVKYVNECLIETGIYIGGLRRTSHRVSDPAPPDVDPREWERERRTLVEQHARVVARRTLSLSRRTLSNLPREMESWRPILTRARERIQVADGGDRGRLRNIVIYCAKMALGRDPFKVESDPIGLLRKLVPVTVEELREDMIRLGLPADGPAPSVAESAPSNSATREDQTSSEEDESSDNHWVDFLYLMERELDVDLLMTLKDWPQNKFHESRDLGNLISVIQKLLEASGDSQIVLTIREYQKADKDAFGRLWNDYAAHQENEALKKQLVEHELPQQPPLATWKRFIAYNLGEAVGFIEGVIVATHPLPVLNNTIQIKHLYVARHMHHAGVSRRLIRTMVEEGNNTAKNGVWLERWKEWPTDDREMFTGSGFVPLGEDRLWYELKLANGRKKPVRRSASQS
jgi:hypothetical protein